MNTQFNITNRFSLTLALILGLGIGLQAQDAVEQAEAAVQDTTWKTGGIVGAGFNQVSLTNWAAGGLSSISGNLTVNLFANYKKDKSTWDNNLDLGYGLLKQGDEDVQKTDDRIELTSKYGREAWSPHWYYSGLLNFRSQFTEGLDANGVRFSDIMAPAYITASLGLDYKPNDKFSAMIAPLTAKFTIVNDDLLAAQGAYGVEPGAVVFDTLGVATVTEEGEALRSEFGAAIRLIYQDKLMENVSLVSRVDLFSNYENPTYIDVNGDVLFSMKVNDYITTTLGMTVLYDHDILITDEDGNKGPRTQFRQIFGVGFAYTL